MVVQKDIDKLSSGLELSDELQEYLDFHRFRYHYLIDKVETCLGKIAPDSANESAKILDVGPHLQTAIIEKVFPGAKVNTMGHKSPGVTWGEGTHFQLNLNSLGKREQWPEATPHDIIIVAEVVEHLSISPITILKFLASFLKKDGIIILQTPNAVALIKRWHMLKGKNPFPIIGEHDPDNFPFHIKESSVEDLIYAGEQARLKIIEWEIVNYFNTGRLKHRFCHAISEVLPKRFRAGITILYQKPEA